MVFPKKLRISLLILLMIILGCVVLYFEYDPAKYIYFPKCPMRILTGLSCPACGMQRALHALLHLRFAEALSYNYFFIYSIPYGVAIIVAEFLKNTERAASFVQFVHHPRLTNTYLLLFFFWFVLRNILHV